MSDEALVEWTIFEGLFKFGLKPQGQFQEDLRTAGLDLARPEPRYPIDVLERSLDVAARHAFGNLPREQAHRELGKLSGEMFFETLVGKITGVAMPLIGADRVLASLPKRVQAGTNEGCAVKQLGERRWEVRFGARTDPDFAAGNLEAALRKCKIEPKVAVQQATVAGVTCLITW